MSYQRLITVGYMYSSSERYTLLVKTLLGNPAVFFPLWLHGKPALQATDALCMHGTISLCVHALTTRSNMEELRFNWKYM